MESKYDNETSRKKWGLVELHDKSVHTNAIKREEYRKATPREEMVAHYIARHRVRCVVMLNLEGPMTTRKIWLGF